MIGVGDGVKPGRNRVVVGVNVCVGVIEEVRVVRGVVERLILVVGVLES